VVAEDKVNFCLVDDQPGSCRYEVSPQRAWRYLIKAGSPTRRSSSFSKTMSCRADRRLHAVPRRLAGGDDPRASPRFQKMAIIFVSAIPGHRSSTSARLCGGRVDYCRCRSFPICCAPSAGVCRALRKTRARNANAELEPRVADGRPNWRTPMRS